MSEEKATEVAANVAPDTFTFNTVLKAWKNSREGIESAKRAEAILRIMIKYDLTNDDLSDIGPDRISFATVMETYICNYVDEPGEALNGFRRVMDLIKDSRSTKEFQEILSHYFGVVIGNMEEYGLNDPTKVAELIFHDRWVYILRKLLDFIFEPLFCFVLYWKRITFYIVTVLTTRWSSGDRGSSEMLPMALDSAVFVLFVMMLSN